MRIYFTLFILSTGISGSLFAAQGGQHRNPTLPDMMNAARGLIGQVWGMAQQVGGEAFGQFVQGMMPPPADGSAAPTDDPAAAAGDADQPPARPEPSISAEDQAALDEVRRQVEDMKMTAGDVMSPEDRATLQATIAKTKADHAAAVDRAEYKPWVRIPLRFGMGREATGEAFNALDTGLNRMREDPRFRQRGVRPPEMPEAFRPGGAGREAVTNLAESTTDLFLPRHLSIGKNDLLRAGSFGVELWALAKMYDSYSRQRVAFITKSLLKNSGSVLEAIAGFDSDAEPSEKKKAAALLRSHRFITLNPLTARRVGIFSLLKQWLLYESLGFFKKMVPVNGTWGQRMKKVMMNKLPRELVGDRPDWEKSIGLGDMPLSSLIYYLRMGMLGKEVFIADATEKLSRGSGFALQMYAAYFGARGLELPALLRTPSAKKVLWFLEKLLLAHLTFVRLDEGIQHNWADYFLKEKEELEVLLHVYEAAQGQPAEREKVVAQIKTFVQRGHLPQHGSGMLMTLVKSFGGERGKTFDKEIVAKGALFVKARLRAMTKIRSLKNLRYVLPLYWVLIKKIRRSLGV